MKGVAEMIQQIWIRKEEKFYKELNTNNLAAYLLKWIPTASFDEIQRKANENDPVI